MKRNRSLNLDKREAILKASIAEFYTKGFDGSSMDTISKVANVSKATVYNHFNNKEELFLAIAYMLQDRMSDAFHYEYSATKSIKEQLYDIAQKEMDFLSLKENITLIQIVTVVMIQKNEIGLKLIEEAKECNMIMTAQWFEAASQHDRIKVDDVNFVARQFIGMIKSFAFYPQLYGAPLLTKEEQEHVMQQAVNMILSLYPTKEN